MMITGLPHEGYEAVGAEPTPCLRCGACCAYFRASFYWGETDDATEGGVPSHLTEKLNDFHAVMKGTNCSKPYCIALDGQIGIEVRCGIYENRSSSCRDFVPAWENGEPNERCDQARAVWGLEPLKPEDWKPFDDYSQVA